MTITVKIGEAKTHLSRLLSRVETGEDVIIQRGHEPIAKLSRIRRAKNVEKAIAEIRAGRDQFKLAPISADEIVAWKNEGRR
ncbi:MAG: type II toxin-antitoxin system Phd/YefM family antitoxin [Hyphomicrobiales bacterium]|nr:type II toxin-antitoxin system Phd/YefM family antitoxin [Hyphomicrobiales bacterium]